MSRMRSFATTAPSAVPDAPVRTVAHLQAELSAVRVELDSVRAERDQLRGLLADLLASQVQLRAQLADNAAQLDAVETERQDTRQQLVDLKRKPFTARSLSDDTRVAKPRGRPAGHPGTSRRRPSRIDQTQLIPAPERCPDCGSSFSGSGTTRERIVEDIVLVRPTLITKFVVVISDFFSAYSPLEVEKAKCWAHLLRDSHDYAKGQEAESERTRFHRTLHELFVEMGLALEQVLADPTGRKYVSADEPAVPHAPLLQRAEAAVARALTEGGAEACTALAERLTVTADAYASGDATERALAVQLRRLLERLSEG